MRRWRRARSAAQLAQPMKRSELLRVDLHMLAQLDDVTLSESLDRRDFARR